MRKIPVSVPALRSTLAKQGLRVSVVNPCMDHAVILLHIPMHRPG